MFGRRTDVGIPTCSDMIAFVKIQFGWFTHQLVCSYSYAPHLYLGCWYAKQASSNLWSDTINTTFGAVVRKNRKRSQALSSACNLLLQIDVRCWCSTDPWSFCVYLGPRDFRFQRSVVLRNLGQPCGLASLQSYWHAWSRATCLKTKWKTKRTKRFTLISTVGISYPQLLACLGDDFRANMELNLLVNVTHVSCSNCMGSIPHPTMNEVWVK